MGWSRGSLLMDEIISSAKRYISDEQDRIKFYEEIISSFQDMDCDTLEECISSDIAFEKAFEMYKIIDGDSGWELGLEK